MRDIVRFPQHKRVQREYYYAIGLWFSISGCQIVGHDRSN